MTSDIAARFGLPLPFEIDARALDFAADHLIAARDGDELPWRFALAIRAFLTGVALGEHRTEAFRPDHLCELSIQALPALMRAAEKALGEARVITGERAFRGLIRHAALLLTGGAPVAPGVLDDAIDHVALFANELDALHRRQAIAERGAPLDRCVTIAAAENADPANASVH